MGEYTWLAMYSGLILLFSLLGGLLPLRGKISHSRLQFYLSLSAGFMLGASFFHVMPDAIRLLKDGFSFGIWMSLGVVGLFCIERFIAPHSHEMDGGGHQHGKEHAHHHDEHDHEHVHDHRAAAPAVAGWMAVLGLTIHTFINGVGLAGEVSDDLPKNLALPGLTIFLAIFIHKPADALAITTVLSRKGVQRWKVVLVQLGFVAMVPIGAIAFCEAKGKIEEGLQSRLTGAALAFSAGTFLFIALSDLLPEVQFHRHDRIPLFLALLVGVILMGGIALLEPEDHEPSGQPPTANGKADPHEEGHKDHGGDTENRPRDPD